MIETLIIVRTQRLILSEFGRKRHQKSKKTRMPLDKVEKVLKISKEPVSPEKPVGMKGSNLGDYRIRKP